MVCFQSRTGEKVWQVDTLTKWVEGHEEYGGIPYCEIVRPLPGTHRLYLFDSYLNHELSERPCATVRYPSNETGSVAWFGFPLYYTQTDQAVALFDRLWEMFGE